MSCSEKFLLGTAIKITSVLSIDPSSITIKIEDPAGTVKVNNVTMTKSADKVYYYVYQSTSTDEDGQYIVTISATSGGYTTVSQEFLTIEEQATV